MTGTSRRVDPPEEGIVHYGDESRYAIYPDEPDQVAGCEDCLELVPEDLQDPDTRCGMLPEGEDYPEPPSTRLARTAQSTICCLVLKPSFFCTPETALRTVSGLISLTSPIS